VARGGLFPRMNEAQIKCLFYHPKWPYRRLRGEGRAC